MAKKSVAPLTLDAAIKKAYEYCRKNSNVGHLSYAATYLAAIPQAVSMFPDRRDEATRIQLQYALGNMGAWKGDEARRVKAVLTAATKPAKTAKAALKPADRKKRTA
jgi:hypothetical protein